MLKPRSPARLRTSLQGEAEGDSMLEALYLAPMLVLRNLQGQGWSWEARMPAAQGGGLGVRHAPGAQVA